MGLLDPLFGHNGKTGKERILSPEERLQNAGFRCRSDADEGCCLICDYDNLNQHVRRCEMHNVVFWEDFSAGKYVCNCFNGSDFDGIVGMMKEEE